MNKRDQLAENSSCIHLPKFKSDTALRAKLNFHQLLCPGSTSLLRSSRGSVRKILLTRTGIKLLFPANSAQTMTNTKAQHSWKLTIFTQMLNPTSIKCHVLFTSTCLGEIKKPSNWETCLSSLESGSAIQEFHLGYWEIDTPKNPGRQSWLIRCMKVHLHFWGGTATSLMKAQLHHWTDNCIRCSRKLILVS